MPDFNRPAYYDRTWENYTPRITWQAHAAQQVLVLVGRAAGLPHVHGHGVASAARRLPATTPEADGHGEFSPQRVQTGRWTVAADQPAAARGRVRHDVSTSGRASELDPNPTRDLVRVSSNIDQVISRSGRRRSRRPRRTARRTGSSNKTRGNDLERGGRRYVTGSHSVKVGYQGNHWHRRPRDVHQHRRHLQYTFLAWSRRARSRCTRTRYNVNAAGDAGRRFYAQDQWTINRLTLQGAIRYDHPWSWFPEQVQTRAAGSSRARRSREPMA